MRQKIVFLGWMAAVAVGRALAVPVPGWNDTLLIDAENPVSWQVEQDDPAAGSLVQSTAGVVGAGIAFRWALGSGQWTQAKYSFSTPLDLSQHDLIGVSLKADGQPEAGQVFQLVFADINNVFYKYELPSGTRGVNRWLINLPIPKDKWTYAFGGSGGPIDWSHINRFFVTVIRGAGPQGLNGVISFDQLQAARTADWPRATNFETVLARPTEGLKALNYIRSQQKETGLIVSWKEESTLNAWLYDQALGLLALTRGGAWASGQPQDDFARSAQSLAEFLVQAQKEDGRWARGWNPATGEERVVDEWVGDQSWMAMALVVYAHASGNDRAAVAARKSGEWIAGRLDEEGKATDSSEGNIDAWWALRAVNRGSDADRVLAYLNTSVWDPSMGYFKGGHQNSFLALDANTWGSSVARAPGVDDPTRALAAVTFAGKTLATRSDSGLFNGLDGMGPVSVWNEGTAQYAAVGGPGANEVVNGLVSQQRPDGSLPGSPDSWSSPFGWLTPWSGLAPTAWFTFALNGRPFLMVPSYTASSNPGAARLAFDHNAGSQWVSLPQDNESITVDYGVAREFDKISIHWGDGFATHYRVETSLDGAVWTVQETVQNGTGGAERLLLASFVQARFARLVIESRNGAGPVALRELTLSAGGAVASSEQSGLFPASFVADGDSSTRWSSGFSDNEWVVLDLGTPRPVGGLVLAWEAAYASAYAIRTSLDGRNWQDAYATTAGDGGEDRVLFAPRDARYVEVRLTQRGTPWGYSLWGIEPLEATQAWASSIEGPGYEAAQANDGNPGTRWASQHADPQWWAVWLGEEQPINKVVLDWEAAYAQGYRIETSLDGWTWSTVYETAQGDGGRDVITFAERSARYVRVFGTARGTPWGYSLWECAVSRDVNGTPPNWATYFGGAGTSVIHDVAVDGAGNTYVVGETSDGHPVTAGAYDTSYNGGDRDGFVAKVRPDGSLVYSTYFGGSSHDTVLSVAVDRIGVAYISGRTYSSDLPTTEGALDRHFDGGRDGFLAKISPDGDHILYGSFLGGSSWDYANRVGVGPLGEFYVAGFTHGGFPTTAGSVQPSFGGLGDAFVVRLTPAGDQFVYSTYLGGGSWDGADGLFVDAAGYVTVAGNTHSTGFPTTAGAYDRTCNNCSTNSSTDGFIAKLNPYGDRLVYSTFVGGQQAPASEGFTGVVVDADGRPTAVGTSDGDDFPVTADAAQPVHGGGRDAVVVTLSADGSQLIYGSYMGGSGREEGRDVAIAPHGKIHVVGLTESVNFPITVGAAQVTSGGGLDTFLATVDGSGLRYATYMGGSGAEAWATLARNSAGVLRLGGGTDSTNFPVTSGAPQTQPGGAGDGYLVAFDSLSEPDQPVVRVTALASSEQGPGFEAIRAVDGDLSTRWSSAFSDPQWLVVSLGEEKTVNQIVLNWEAAYAKSYQIQVSLDGNQWTDVYATETGDGGEDVIRFQEHPARFVRILGTERGTPYGYSLFECAVSYQSIPAYFSLGPPAADGTLRAVFDDADRLHVTYFDPSKQGLRYVVWDGSAWTGDEMVDDRAGGYPAQDGVHVFLQANDLAVDAVGRPHVIYYSRDGHLSYAVKEAGSWRVESVATVPSSVVASLVVDPAGTVHVAYSNPGELYHAWREKSGWRVEPVAGAVAANTNHMAVDGAGRLHLVYGTDRAPHALHYTRRDSAGWTAPEQADLEDGWRYRVNPTLVIDGDGRPRVVDCLNNRDGRVRYSVRTDTGWVSEFAHYDARDWNHTGTPEPGFLLDGAGRPHTLYAMHFRHDPHWVRTLTGTRDDNGWQETSWAEDQTWGAPAALALDAQGRQHLITYSTEDRVRLIRLDDRAPVPMGGGRNGRVQAPTGFTLVATTTSVQYTWTDNASNEVGYRLYGSTVAEGPYSVVAELPADAVSYVEETPTEGPLFRYVAVRNAGGEVGSTLESAVVFRGPGTPYRVSRSTTSLRWKWTDNSNAETGVPCSSCFGWRGIKEWSFQQHRFLDANGVAGEFLPERPGGGLFCGRGFLFFAQSGHVYIG
jgi:hypothetical protein